MSVYRKAALCAALLVCASEASAATIVQTVSSSNGPAYVEKFDTRYGTLNSVTVTSYYFARRYFKYFIPDSPPPVINVVGTIGDSLLGTADITGNYQSVFADANIVSIFLEGNSTKTLTGAEAEFFQNYSLPTFPLFGSVNATFSAEPAVVSYPFGSGGRFTVTYDYDEVAAVPEPSTWALMLAGFGLVGYALRRRAKVAFA